MPESRGDRCLALPGSQGLALLELHIKWPKSDKQWPQLLCPKERAGNCGEFLRALTAIGTGALHKWLGRDSPLGKLFTWQPMDSTAYNVLPPLTRSTAAGQPWPTPLQGPPLSWPPGSKTHCQAPSQDASGSKEQVHLHLP